MTPTCSSKKTPSAAMCSPDCTCWKPTKRICIASSVPMRYHVQYAMYVRMLYL